MRERIYVRNKYKKMEMYTIIKGCCLVLTGTVGEVQLLGVLG